MCIRKNNVIKNVCMCNKKEAKALKSMRQEQNKQAIATLQGMAGILA